MLGLLIGLAVTMLLYARHASMYAPSATPPHARLHPARPQIFRRMHTAFADAVSNPFYVLGTPLVSPRFDASVRTIATSLGAAA